MDDSDQEMSEEVESDNEAWASLIPGPDERIEQCKLGKDTVNLPELLLEKEHIFMSVLSMDTWDNVLTDAQRHCLEALLPNFPEHNKSEKRETVRTLLGGENIKFGNPLSDLHKKLKEGYMNPEIARYRKQTRQFRYKDYKMRYQRHISDLLKQLLLSRQDLFEQAISMAPGEPYKFQYRPPLPRKASQLEILAKKKTARVLKEVREECGVPDTSSDEEEEPCGSSHKSRRQLFKSLGAIPSPEPTIPSVVATYAAKPVQMNGEVNMSNHQPVEDSPAPALQSQPNNKRSRPISPVEITDDNVRDMLRTHKKKRLLQPDLPELDTSSITVQDIMTRCQANKKNFKAVGENTSVSPAVSKKKIKVKDKGEKKRKSKIKEHNETVEEETNLPVSQIDSNFNLPDVDDDRDENRGKFIFGPSTNFFCLIRDTLVDFPESSISVITGKFQEWRILNNEISNPWLVLQKDWIEQIPACLRFLLGKEVGEKKDHFMAYVELNEYSQTWSWCGRGRDSDLELASIFRLWLQLKTERLDEVKEKVSSSPPPPKVKTNFVVRPTSSNEKAMFREQEHRRFAAPHKAFTFMMHGYDSVVGPVKGVYDKDSGTNKAREHNLLISDRPPFVTILTLVRDAAARLPNGEGTRGDICELLKDSQFLAPGVTDAQINAVVSGALDRLHSEKDPCVKYDVNRKLWIYLHRNRTEDEFDRIHQAQGAAVKAKKNLQRPKATKIPKEPPLPVSTVATTTSSVLTLSTLPTSVPPTVQVSKPVFTLTAPHSQTSTPENTDPELVASLPKTVKNGHTSKSSTSAGLPMSATVAQLRAAQVATGKSNSGTSSKPQTVRQLTSSSFTTAGNLTNVTTSVLTVTSLGLSVTSSLAAQLLYSPGLSQMAAPKHAKHTPTPTTFNLVTTMNVSHSATTNQVKAPNISTISMLQNQQSKQHQIVSQNVLKQNVSAISTSGQTVSASKISAMTNKLHSSAPKQNFTIASRQTPPPNVVVTKSHGATIKTASGLKQASLILSQEGVGSFGTSQATGNILPPTSKLVALTSVSGSPESTVMAHLVSQPATNRGMRPQAVKLQGGSIMQPVLSGKHVQISGKPLKQTKAGLVQVSSKTGQSLGIIRTPQGPLSAFSLIPQTAVCGNKSATVVAVGAPSPVNVLTSSSIATVSSTNTRATSVSLASQSSSPASKVLGHSQTGIMVSQLPQGLAIRTGLQGSMQSKVGAAGQTSLVPAQLILQAPGGATQTSSLQGVSGPLLVSNPQMKEGQNLQVMRTVLSHPGNLKAGQATILISPQNLPQVAVPASSTAASGLQASGKSMNRSSPKSKGQPVYARIITPPPGMKLTNLAQVPGAGVTSATGVNVLQMGKLLATSGAHTLPVVNFAVPQTMLNTGSLSNVSRTKEEVRIVTDSSAQDKTVADS